ncbi:DUF3120 domain-containing protein [Stenomitos frigidus ULC18]|uniref:DUF3120 domain-containing protein n=1 Tax=Stenomitos frigidus ULC18 TaxID=2107698 RepID=A0A2T1E9B1_9CYAN|nr:DUF3120 domain-containing protein [Stenomitos frigidus ULC18]
MYPVESLAEASEAPSNPPIRRSETLQRWLIFAASIVLVSVPVFMQAPLVRLVPWISLGLTMGWLLLGLKLLKRPATQRWGDLLIGFTWTWLAGSVYWGWLRWEPLLHLPVEAIGLPFAIWGVSRNIGKVGNFFYFGSLLGTVVTDVYFYLVDLIPYWRQLMQVESDAVQPIFQSALAQIQTPWGAGWAISLALLLLTVSVLPLFSRQLHWWGFSGAVLSTILVDGLFWLAAIVA